MVKEYLKGEVSRASHSLSVTNAICRRPGHSRTCEYYESWFESGNDDHGVFQGAFREANRRNEGR